MIITTSAGKVSLLAFNGNVTKLRSRYISLNHCFSLETRMYLMICDFSPVILLPCQWIWQHIQHTIINSIIQILVLFLLKYLSCLLRIWAIGLQQTECTTITSWMLNIHWHLLFKWSFIFGQHCICHQEYFQQLYEHCALHFMHCVHTEMKILFFNQYTLIYPNNFINLASTVHTI